jgi:hypothetical protein
VFRTTDDFKRYDNEGRLIDEGFGVFESDATVGTVFIQAG